MRFGFYYSHAFDWGDPDAPSATAYAAGVPQSVLDEVVVLPFNRTEHVQNLRVRPLRRVAAGNGTTVTLPGDGDYRTQPVTVDTPGYYTYREWIGAQIRAAVDNQRMARGLGIDVDRAFMITFALGGGRVTVARRFTNRPGGTAG